MPHTVDLQAIAHRAMVAGGLVPDFPPQVAAQLATLRSRPDADAGGSKDLRALTWCSIDNDESRDLDQLSVAEPLSEGRVRVLISIADVTATVAVDTPIDAHARSNTTSVYTAVQIFPMLPEALSFDMTSLVQGGERASLVVELTVERNGMVSASDVYRARVTNRAKLAYNSVAAWLAGKAAAPEALARVPGLEQNLRLQDDIAQRLKRVRSQRGALDLQTLEAQPVLHHGTLSDLVPDASNRAKELIQHLMIAANEAAAQYLERRGRASLRRVLRTPERWDRIVALARQCGDALPDTPDAPALSQFLDRRRSAAPDRFADLSVAVVKLLGSGEYALKLPGAASTGHFGLASAEYSHCTAPNRRFPDMIMHRLIKAALDERPAPYDAPALAGLAAHCTLQEHNAAKVERRVRKSAAAALLAPRLGEHFDAVVTGVSDQGTWVRITAPLAEGMLVAGSQALDVGDRLRVQLTHTDVERGFIDFVAVR